MQKRPPLPLAGPQRKWWALKRVWTLLTVLFCAAYLGVLRFGARLGGRGGGGGARAAAAALKAAAAPPRASSGAAGLAAGYARLAAEGRAGLPPLTRAGGAYANDVNDLGACAARGMEGAASLAAPAPAPAAAAAAAAPWVDPTLASPLCLELLATEPWRSSAAAGSARRRIGGGGGGGGGGSSSGSSSAAAVGASKSATAPGAKLWSAPVCGFLARELAAAAAAAPAASAAAAAAAAPPAAAATAAARSLASGELARERLAPPPGAAASVAACGSVRVTGGDLARMCGREPSDLPALLRQPRTLNPYSRNASHTFFMWNKALAAACDGSPSVMVDDGPQLPLEEYLAAARAGGRTFYVVTTQLLQFIEQVVPQLAQPFVVVSGSSDVSGPLEGMGWSEHTLARVNGLLAHPLLVGLFAQNPDYKHPKMVPIHIGFDFHTIGRPALGEGPEAHEWGAPASALAQDAQLLSLRCALPPFAARPARAVMNFKSSGRSIRSEVHALLRGRAGVEWIERASRSELWQRYGEFAFVVSPRGYGKDCHRTWEALALGSAVIVSRDSFMAPLYEDLPVVQLSDWSEVTAENLERWKRELGARWHTFRFEKLRTDFWLEAINAAAQQGSLEGIWNYTVDGREARGNYSSGQLVWGRRGGRADPPWQYWG